MAPLDLGILAVIGGYFINGIRRGFVHEVLGLIGVIAGLLAGIMFGSNLATWITDFFPSFEGIALHLFSFTMLFSTFYYLARLVAGLVTSIVENLLLGWLNNIAGGTAAAFKGALILSLLFMYLSFVPYQKALEPYQAESQLYQPIYQLVPKLYDYIGSDRLPDKVKEIFNKGKEKIREKAVEDLKNDFKDQLDEQLGND
ncbi:MAG: CvpA family protein [Calditrichia bacterium]